MRNYFAIAFTLVYLTLAVGVAKTTHYCMGREKHSSLFSFSTKQCPCALFAKEIMSCCGDEHEILKIEDDHSTSQVIHSPAPEFTLIGEMFSLNLPALQVEESFYTIDELNIPPPKLPRYQTFCSLVFYDSIV